MELMVKNTKVLSQQYGMNGVPQNERFVYGSDYHEDAADDVMDKLKQKSSH